MINYIMNKKNAAHVSLEPGSEGVFLKNHWPFGANTLRVEYVTRVLLSHEVSSASEFPMSCRLLVSLEPLTILC